jgi:hypothetical protein
LMRRMSVDRYNLALLLLALAVVPLFCASAWCGVAALVALYGLVARLANKDLDRRYARLGGSLRHLRKR